MTTTQYSTRSPEETVGALIIKALVSHTLDDISMDQMNRIVNRLSQMSRPDRDAPVRVALVIADEIGEEKALRYIEQALANGLITKADYEQMRATIVLRMPRTEVPAPWAAAGIKDLLEGQKGIQSDLARLRKTGEKSLVKALEKLNEDIERIKRAWGIR
jgi:hypothetical protein